MAAVLVCHRPGEHVGFLLVAPGLPRGAGHPGAIRQSDGRKDFYTLTEKGLDLIPIVLNIVLWSAQHEAKSYVRHSKEFLARLRRNPVKVSEEVKALVRSGGCIFPGAGA